MSKTPLVRLEPARVARDAESRCVVGLIGTGIATSASPALHERAADRLGLRYLYRLIDLVELGLEPDAVGALLVEARRMGFTGLNTSPTRASSSSSRISTTCRRRRRCSTPSIPSSSPTGGRSGTTRISTGSGRA